LKYIISLIVCFCAVSPLFAQILDQPYGNDFTHAQKFDPSFIARNKIKEIRAIQESKKDRDRIRKTNESMVYQFYPDGNLQMQALINHNLRDTAVTIFEYAGERLSCEIKNDAAGMFSYCYAYDNTGLPLSRIYGRPQKAGRLTSANWDGKTTEISTEKMTHQRYELQLHSTLFNAGGRPYQKEIRYYDENDYLIQYSRSYVMSSDRYEEKYGYESHGWLSEKEIISAKEKYTLKYSYDAVGNLLSEERYENETLVYRKEYVYEGSNMMLKAELRRDDIRQYIYITTYTFRYW